MEFVNGFKKNMVVVKIFKLAFKISKNIANNFTLFDLSDYASNAILRYWYGSSNSLTDIQILRWLFKCPTGANLASNNELLATGLIYVTLHSFLNYRILLATLHWLTSSNNELLTTSLFYVSLYCFLHYRTLLATLH